jgi:hypothetical protein
MRKKKVIPMTKRQHKTIVDFLASHKIYCDGNTEFALVAEPRILEKEFEIILLNTKEAKAIKKSIEEL